jgi:hypothetical protein
MPLRPAQGRAVIQPGKSRMLSTYKRNTNIGVGIGWIIMAGAGGVVRAQPPMPLAAAALYLAGATLFLWGCVQYARGKGHSGWWGALGLLWILGLLVLFFLPDRHKAGGDVQPREANRVPPTV